LQLSGSYTDAKLTQDQVSAIIVAPGRRGNQIPYTAKWTVQGSAQYSWPLTAELLGLIRADVNYNSSSWTTFQHTDSLRQMLPGFAEVGTRVGLESDQGGWGAYLFVRNLFDTVGINYMDTSVLYGRGGYVRATAITPRTIGFEVHKQF